MVTDNFRNSSEIFIHSETCLTKRKIYIIHDLFNKVRRAINFLIKYKPRIKYYFYNRIALENIKMFKQIQGEKCYDILC